MADIPINAVTRRVQFTGNTGTGPFAFTFEILANTDIAVYKNATLLTLTTDYTVTINANGTGSVTLTGSGSGTALVASDYLTIIGNKPLARTTDFTTAGDLLASALNDQLDANVIMNQQLDERVDRALRQDPDDVDGDMTIPAKADRLGNYLRFNATTGNPEVGNVTGLYTAAGLNVYNFTGDGSDTTFTLGIDPGVENNTQVYIDGVYQQKNTYSVTGKVITFSAAPPNLSTIEVMVTQPMAVGETTASSVSFVQDGASTERTVQLKLQESVSVKDFGAVGDGTTDDTAAIQAADAAAPGILRFPAGTYKITSAITKTLGVSWVGDGYMEGAQTPQQASTTIVIDGPTSGDFITVDGATTGVGEANLEISGIAFEAQNSSSDVLIGINSKIKVFSVRNCSFKNFSTGIKHNQVETWIVGNYFSSCVTCIDSSGGESHIEDNHGFPETTGILVRGSATIVQGNKFYGDGASGDFGIIVWGRGNTIVNNVLDAFTDAGIIIRSNTTGLDANSNIVCGNNISGIGDGGTYDSAIVLDATNEDVDDNVISSNSIFNKRADRTTVNGIEINVAAGKTVSGNIISNNSISDVTNALTASGSGTRTDNIITGNNGSNPLKNFTKGVAAGYNGLTVNHGLGFTPDHVSVTPESSNAITGVDTINSTSFRLLMRDSSGTLIPSGSPVNVNWVATLYDYT